MNIVIDTRTVAVVAFENVFQEGDRWKQIAPCDRCGECCGRCKLKMPNGQCRLHVEDRGQKPFGCIIAPNPTSVVECCSIQFECVKGDRLGEIIKVSGK